MDAMKARTPAIVLLSFVIVLILLPAATAAGPGIGDWAQETELEADHSTTYTWTIYNSDSNTYALKIDPVFTGSHTHVSATVNSYPKIISPGDYADVSVTLDAERAAPTQTIVLDVNFILTNLDADPYIETVQTKTVTLNVTSLIASTGNNIFFWENTLPAPFNTAIWTFILTIGIWALITAAVVIVIDPILKYFFGKSKLSFISKIYKLVKKPVFLTVLIYGLVNSLTILSVSADTILVIKDGLVVFFIALYAWVAYKVYNDVIIDYARRLASKTETELDDALVPFLHTLGVIAIPLVAFIAILNYFNISFTAILAGLGVGSLVIGLAAQDTFSSIFAGIQIMVDRPFKVGDRIILSTGQVCDVKKIGIRSTRAYGVTNHEMIVIPNVLLCNNKVTNISRPDGHRAISVEVGVAYGTDIEKAEKILLQIAADHPDVVKNNPAQAPYTRLSLFDDSAIKFALWVYVDNYTKEWRVRSELREQIDQRFSEAGIEIPLPQTVVTFVNSPRPSTGGKQNDAGEL
ncbi:mechanosensitive ion channel family protein [Candidatus Methanomassiliicoccus intestinalis]|uniref:mechanosensitive ion channel family protein n=1 Tax=Candidatus Methanomassiliicoccus intestinalis TaxID=1406512 RepID=UPI0037DBF752